MPKQEILKKTTERKIGKVTYLVSAAPSKRANREEAGEDDPQGSRAKRRKRGGLTQLSQNQQTGRRICGISIICVGQDLSYTYSLVWLSGRRQKCYSQIRSPLYIAV